MPNTSATSGDNFSRSAHFEVPDNVRGVKEHSSPKGLHEASNKGDDDEETGPPAETDSNGAE